MTLTARQSRLDTGEGADLRPIHPALDEVDGVLYVTVRARMGGTAQDIVLTSEGDEYTQEEWGAYCKERGLDPIANGAGDLQLAGVGARWANNDIAAWQDGQDAPGWKETFDAIRRALTERLELRDPRYYTVLALYGMATYFHPLFRAFPFLWLRGPAGSGKSVAGIALAQFAFNGAVHGGISASATFRTAHAGRNTLVWTEADRLKEGRSGDAEISKLQACFTAAEATEALTSESGGRERGRRDLERYLTYSPRVFLSTTNFGSHPLRTRCIRLDITQTVGARQDVLDRGADVKDPVWGELRGMLYPLLLTHWRDVGAKRDAVKAEGIGVTGREKDKWLPLATMAALVSPDVLAQVKGLAREQEMAQRADASTANGEALIFKFARWVVKDAPDGKPWEVGADELYKMFTGADMPGWQHDMDVPWAQESGVTDASPDKLKRWIHNRDQLVAELKRLDLMDKEPKRTSGRNLRVFRPEYVRAHTAGYIGEEDQEEEAA